MTNQCAESGNKPSITAVIGRCKARSAARRLEMSSESNHLDYLQVLYRYRDHNCGKSVTLSAAILSMTKSAPASSEASYEVMTAIVRRPAARADAMPHGESSIARQSAGAIGPAPDLARSSTARRYGSGAGLLAR